MTFEREAFGLASEEKVFTTKSTKPTKVHKGRIGVSEHRWD
jgi:hypothetical protein